MRHGRVSLVSFKGLRVRQLYGLAHGLAYGLEQGCVRPFRELHGLAQGHVAWPCDPSQRVTWVESNIYIAVILIRNDAGQVMGACAYPYYDVANTFLAEAGHVNE
ncbi:hypothetical protein Goari_011462 [Gossypium aridum]|uniref:Uncharacterized protein n=1 Tax=Gossypium aridum TaxID=34290 RepID=A0A7J8WXC1_GOSAI|nr:hypothetical protein [Gossypium aridum]